MNRIGLLLLLSVAACFAQPAPPRPPRVATVERMADSFLGVGVAEIDSERAKELKLKEERGVEVKRVEDESPAAKAGVKVGDVVLDYNGQRVEGAEQFVRLVRETPVGRQVKLLISRNGATQTVTATVGSRPAFISRDIDEAIARLKTFQPFQGSIPRPMISLQSRAMGVESESLSSQLAQFFGVTEGALVRSVVSGSAAEKAGIKAGDVITKVGDRKVSGPSDVSSAVRSSTGATVPVTLVRNQKEMTVNVALGERPVGGVRRSVVRIDVKIL